MKRAERCCGSIVLWGLALFAGCFHAATARGSNFDVTQWSLDVGVQASGGNGQAAFFTAVTNPFYDEHSVALASPPATAWASYDLSWNSQGGIFHIDAAQTAGGAPFLFAVSSGTIRIRPNTDLTVRVDALYQYALAPGDREAEMTLSIRLFPQGGGVWGYSGLAMPIVGDPPSGIIERHDLVNLPALPEGFEYRLGYLFSLSSYSGSPSAISTGTGQVTFTVIPEPALGLLAPALLLIARRRRTDRR